VDVAVNVARLPEEESVFPSVKFSREEKIAAPVPRNAKSRPVWVSAHPLASICLTATVATEVASGDVNSPLDVQMTAWRRQL